MKNNKHKVSTISKPGHNMQNRGVSNTGAAAYGGNSRSAGFTRNREDVRPKNDEQMNSTLSGRGSPTPNPERRGNINDGNEQPVPDRSPSVEGQGENSQ